jgi:hypothetical protein
MAANSHDSGSNGEPGALGRELVANMPELTWNRIGEQALRNADANLPFIGSGQSLAALRGVTLGAGPSAVVIGAGPSIRRRDPAKVITASGYPGAVLATESAMLYLLRAGIVPDLVVTADPHTKRIVRWFGDPTLTEASLAEDDYFKRQDMDISFASELETNREILGLLAKHGKNMRIALSTSASELVVRRATECGMQIFWWNPMLDDPDRPDSVTRRLHATNGMPCVNAGGNVGAACWMIATEVLAKSAVAVTGMDFSYYDGTPYSQTQYYKELVALVGEDKLDSVYMRLFNPHTKEWAFTDPAYMWYRENFLEMVRDSDCQTANCTEGGILFGDGIEFIKLEEFVRRHVSNQTGQPARRAASHG